MSYSYWRVIAALGFLILACGFSNQQGANQQRQDAASSRSQAPETPPAEDRATDSGKSYSPACNDPKDREDASFCIERRAVLAAEKANVLSDKIFWPTVGGIFVGALSAGFAGWAAREAGRAAVAAERSLDHADDVMRNDLRAYVHADRAEIKWGEKGRKPSIIIWAKNTGQTPAKWFGARSMIVSHHRPKSYTRAEFEASGFKDRDEHQWTAMSGQGGSLSFSGTRNGDRLTLADAFKTGNTISVTGVIRYETLFDEIFETEFWFVAHGPHEPDFETISEKLEGVVSIREIKERPRALQRAAVALSTYKKVDRAD